MLMKSIELLIRKGRIEGLDEKISTLYVLGKLTKDEYDHLREMLDAMSNIIE